MRVATQSHMPLAHHVTMRLEESHWIAREVDEVRRFAHLMYRIGNHTGLLAFCLSDTHLHCLIEGTRAEAGELTRRLEIAMSRTLRLGVRFERARIRRVAGPTHLRNAVTYLFRQSAHHETRFDPHMEGSSLLDIMGLRRIGAEPTTARLFRALPRLTRQSLRPLLRMECITEPSTTDLIDAASAVVATPHLRGKTPPIKQARLALAHLLADVMTPTSLAQMLGLSRLARPERSQSTNGPRRGSSTASRSIQSPDPMLVSAIVGAARLRASRAHAAMQLTLDGETDDLERG